MRLLTSLHGKAKAESLVAYLLTQQISTHVEPGKSSEDWEVWIRDEDRLSDAKRELLVFLEEPDHPRYAEAVKSAHSIVERQKKKRQETNKNIRTGRQVFRGGPMSMNRVPPVTLTLLIISAVLSLLTNFMKPRDSKSMGATVMNELQFVSFEDYSKGNNDPAASLKKGEFWRTITPMFLHGNTFHLLFNFIAMIQLGKIVENMEGTWRYILLVLATGIFAALLQGMTPESLMGNPFFGGLSGVVYGVFGFLMAKSWFQPNFGFRISDVSVMIMVGWLILGFTGLLGREIANLAHLGGFVAGIAIGFFAATTAPR